jgi:phenylacetate-CoA ligase
MQVLLDEPPPRVEPPLRLQVEHGPGVTAMQELRAELEGFLREKLIVRTEVELVAPGTLPRYEMKAQPLRRLYEEGEVVAR